MNFGKGKFRFKSHYLAVFFLLSLVSAAIYLSSENEPILDEKASKQDVEIAKYEEERIIRKEEDEQMLNKVENVTISKNEENIARNKSITRCDLFSGKWVLDNVSYPLYTEGKCSFMIKDYACGKNGRKEMKYQNWRWQPHDCDLPRFDGKALLEKIRGKRLVYVGDSLNKNQWISMLCLVESSLHPSTSKLVTLDGNLFTFRATEYNATIEFYWSPLLVESNCDNPETHRVKDRIMRVNSIEKHARHWTDADILIFDSFMWWLDPTMTILWGPFGSSDAIHKRVEMKLRRYEMALSTWSDWLEININRTRTKLFFMSLSPFHFLGETMGPETYCFNQTEPIFKEDFWGLTTDREMMNIAESTIQKLESRGLKVEYLNITHLSDYRKDGHPAINTYFQQPLSREELANIKKSNLDCAHWCLPGVPDVWNQILYSYIMKL